MSQPHWQQTESFDIDDGQLDGLSPQQCFVLGYELAQIVDLLASPGPRTINRPVHAANRDRIEARCKASGRPYTIGWMQDDGSEGWLWLKVDP